MHINLQLLLQSSPPKTKFEIAKRRQNGAWGDILEQLELVKSEKKISRSGKYIPVTDVVNYLFIDSSYVQLIVFSP